MMVNFVIMISKDRELMFGQIRKLIKVNNDINLKVNGRRIKCTEMGV